jgi:hypothetical protein
MTGWENDDRKGESQQEDRMTTTKVSRLYGPTACWFLFIAFMGLGLTLGHGFHIVGIPVVFPTSSCLLSDSP